jgi:putative endonuclease
MYYTYILFNKITNRYYIGYTPNLKKRIQKHTNGLVLSTKSNRNYKLEWYCAFKTRIQALDFEKYLKTGSGIAFMKKRFLKLQ